MSHLVEIHGDRLSIYLFVFSRVKDPGLRRHFRRENVQSSSEATGTQESKARVVLFFVLPTLPTQFFENLKKVEDIFFQFYFCIFLRLMPAQSWSSIFCRFVFATAARLIKLPPVTAPGDILRRKHKFVFPAILIQLENRPNEFYFYFYFVLRLTCCKKIGKTENN